MLSGSGTTDGLAQNGVFKSPSSKKFFYDALEYTSSPSGLVLIPNSGTGSLPWGRPTNGTDYTYKTSWEDGGDNKIHFIFCSSATNCVDYAHTSWNPASAGWIGADAVWSEETHYTPSDIAGTLSSKATFLTLMLRKHASGGGSAWYDVSSVSKCDSSGTGRCGSGSYWRYFTDMLNSSTAFADWTCPIDPSQPAC
jgi:hypothetical protein